MENISGDNKRILRGVFGGGAQTFISIAVSIIQIRLVLSFVPRDIAGTWFLFLTIGAYIAFFDLGVGPTLSREIGFATGRSGGPEKAAAAIAGIIATCSRLFQLISLAVFAVACSAGAFFLGGRAAGGGEILAAWLIFSAGAVLNLLGGTAFSALYGLGHVGTERLNRAVFQAAGLVLAFAALKAGLGIKGLALAWAVQNLLARLSAWALLNRYHPELKAHKGVPSMAIARRILGPSMKWAGMNLGALFILNSDNILISSLIGSSAIPPYEAVAKVISAIMILSMLNVASSVPFLSKAHAAGETGAFHSLFYRNIRFGVGLIIILTSFFSVFGERIINVWLGPGNFAGFAVLWILSATLIMEVHHTIHATVTMSAGHIIFLKAALLAGFLKVASSAWLSSYFGIAGIAAGTLLAQVLTNNWYAPYITLKLFNIPAGRYFREVGFPLLALLALTLGSNVLLIRLTGDLPELPGLLLSFPLSFAIGAGLFIALVLPRDERLRAAVFFKGLYER